MKDHDYMKLGLKAGLEIHQQLNTTSKLFCSSVAELKDTKDATYEFYRYLRPSKSELGEIDRACLLYTSPSPRDGLLSRMPSSA